MINIDFHDRIHQWEAQQHYAIGQASTPQELQVVAQQLSNPCDLPARRVEAQCVSEAPALLTEQALCADLLYYADPESVEGHALRSEAGLLKAIRNRVAECRWEESLVVSAAQRTFESAMQMLVDLRGQRATLRQALTIAPLNAVVEKYICRFQPSPVKLSVRSNVPLWEQIRLSSLLAQVAAGNAAALSEWVTLRIGAINQALTKEELLEIAKPLLTQEGSLTHRMAQRMAVKVNAPASGPSDPLLYADPYCFESSGLQHEAFLLACIERRAVKRKVDEVLTPMQKEFMLAMGQLLHFRANPQTAHLYAHEIQQFNRVAMRYRDRFFDRAPGQDEEGEALLERISQGNQQALSGWLVLRIQELAQATTSKELEDMASRLSTLAGSLVARVPTCAHSTAPLRYADRSRFESQVVQVESALIEAIVDRSIQLQLRVNLRADQQAFGRAVKGLLALEAELARRSLGEPRLYTALVESCSERISLMNAAVEEYMRRSLT